MDKHTSQLQSLAVAHYADMFLIQMLNAITFLFPNLDPWIKLISRRRRRLTFPSIRIL